MKKPKKPKLDKPIPPKVRIPELSKEALNALEDPRTNIRPMFAWNKKP
jgi:hypothetical protein